MHRVTLYALTMPPSPMLYRDDFETRREARKWRDWARNNLPCHARLESKPGA